MKEFWYCPSCRIKVPDGESALACSGCDADFGPNAAWGPVQNDKGKWSPRKSEGDDRPSIGYAIFQFIFRLFIGGLVWVVMLALAILSAVPYGGGSKGLFALLQVTTTVVLVWAVFPVAKALYQLTIGSRDEPKKSC